MSSRIARRLERRARSTTARFGLGNDSGADVTLAMGTPRKSLIRSRSASNHASTEWTAMRNRMCGAGRGSNRATRVAAHAASALRSRMTDQGAKFAARLYPCKCRSSESFPLSPWTGPTSMPRGSKSRRIVTASAFPSAATVTNWAGTINPRTGTTGPRSWAPPVAEQPLPSLNRRPGGREPANRPLPA